MCKDIGNRKNSSRIRRNSRRRRRRLYQYIVS
jgi:hypothetical protein